MSDVRAHIMLEKNLISQQGDYCRITDSRQAMREFRRAVGGFRGSGG